MQSFEGNLVAIVHGCSKTVQSQRYLDAYFVTEVPVRYNHNWRSDEHHLGVKSLSFIS